MSSGYRLGIDLGGTKIEAAVIGPDGGFADRRRVPNPRTYSAILDAIAALIADSEQASGQSFDRLGFSIPRSPSPANGLIRNANSTDLNGRPFGADLEARLGRRVRLANDANSLALSEAVDGAAAGLGVVFGVWGLALALPVMAIVKVVMDYLRDDEDAPAQAMA
jgi:fructokinase